MASKTEAPKRNRRKAPVVVPTLVTLIVDRSTSMAHLTNAVIEGFNSYIEGLRQQEGETLVSLVTFADNHDEIFVDIPLEDVADLTSETYQAYGNTSLYDTIVAVAASIERRHAGREDVKHLILTISDGEDTCSVEHNAATSAAIVREYEKRDNWTFSYIGLGMSRQYVGSQRGALYSGNSGYVATADAAGVFNSFAGAALGTNMLRSSSKRSSQNLMADAGVDIGSPAASSPDPDLGSVPNTASAVSRSEGSLADFLGGGR